MISCTILASGVIVYRSIANNYNVTENCSININNYLTVKRLGVGSEITEAIGQIDARAGQREYAADVMLMNLIPIKTIKIHQIEEMKVIPCGNPFGVKIFTKGAIVVGLSDVMTANGAENPAKLAGIQKGDIILSVNEREIKNNEDLSKIIEVCEGKEISLNIIRDNNKFNAVIRPAKSESDKAYKIGLWVRDSSAGIGTMTFYDPESNIFGGLGHGICDVDTGELLPLSHGSIVNASINGITKGVKGMPGELKGYFIECDAVGELTQNTYTGVYGYLKSNPYEKEAITVAMKQQVRKGKAQILTTVYGVEPKLYEIDIQSINYNEDLPSKNMIVKIIDQELLNETGGIIQGMSGSPIIQNGMLVGAITHVFVNDPQKGYAIFAENMTYKSKKSSSTANKKLA